MADQDFRLAELVAAEGRACVIVVNKWDMVAGKDSNTHVEFQKEVLSQLRALSWATILFTSATTGEPALCPAPATSFPVTHPSTNPCSCTEDEEMQYEELQSAPAKHSTM